MAGSGGVASGHSGAGVGEEVNINQCMPAFGSESRETLQTYIQ